MSAINDACAPGKVHTADWYTHPLMPAHVDGDDDANVHVTHGLRIPQYVFDALDSSRPRDSVADDVAAEDASRTARRTARRTTSYGVASAPTVAIAHATVIACTSAAHAITRAPERRVDGMKD